VLRLLKVNIMCYKTLRMLLRRGLRALA
jgi:hypothetical protein